MMRTAAFLQCIVLTVGGLPGFPQPGCLWDDLLDEESVSRVELRGRRSVSLSMFFIYVNPPELGACILGDDLYRTVSDDVLADEPNRHVFWVGVGGAFVDLFRAQRIYMIQGDRRFDVVSTRTIKGAISNPTILAEILITLEGEIDFSEPVTIFYRSGMGTYSNEYWLPDKYLKNIARRDMMKQHRVTEIEDGTNRGAGQISLALTVPSRGRADICFAGMPVDTLGANETCLQRLVTCVVIAVSVFR